MGRADERALERFVRRRDAGDSEGAAAAWNEVVELLHDRIAQVVALQARKSGVDRDEVEDVVQAVHLNVWNYARTFTGTSMGELHKSLKTMAHARCADHIDARVRQRRDAQSLDEVGYDDGGEGGADRRPHDVEIEEAWKQHLHDESEGDVEDFLAWALPQLERRQRIAWEDAQAGVDPEVTMTKLRVTLPNLYQLRRRALLKLKTLYTEFFLS